MLDVIFEPGIYNPLWWGMFASGIAMYFLSYKLD